MRHPVCTRAKSVLWVAENTDKDCCRARGLPDGCGPNPDTNVPCNYLAAVCCGDFCKLPHCGCNTATTCDDSGRVSAPCPTVNPYDPSPSDQTCTDCTDDDVCCVPDHVPIDTNGCLWGAWLVGWFLVICWPIALVMILLATGCWPGEPAIPALWCGAMPCMLVLGVIPVRMLITRDPDFHNSTMYM